MEWIRGEVIGQGSFSTINLAIRNDNPSSLMAVKSAFQNESAMLHKERDILSSLSDSPRILRCLGDDTTFEDGREVYNVFLELATRGDLAELLKISGGKMKESNVRRYAKSIVEGLCFIHARDYVHCDIKLQNILVCSSSSADVKIGDFGLAKKVGDEKNSILNGTPLYMSPESVCCNEQETPADIWALGCVVLEMITGKSAWRCGVDVDVISLLFRIGFTDELPQIPDEISEQGKDFLKRCLVRDPTKRWTAEMLLDHPFLAYDDEIGPLPALEKLYRNPSPRSAFDFPDWTPTPNSLCSSFDLESPVCRIRHLALAKELNWSNSDGWINVRT